MNLPWNVVVDREYVNPDCEKHCHFKNFLTQRV